MTDTHATLNADSLAGKTAVVTGSSRGIGRAIALQLAAAGADVMVHGRSSDAACREVTEEIVALGRSSCYERVDLADEQSHEPLVAAAWDWQDGVDIWVNCAGLDVLTGPAAEWSFAEKLARLWEVDVRGTICLSRLIGARMKSRGAGCIVNIGWDQAETGMAGDSGEMFAATKGAIMAFTRSLARSLAPAVRVNCVAPGWIRTAWGAQASDYWQQRATRESLLERWGEPADVAHAVRYLASPAASFVTGHILPVNGGLRQGE